MKDKFLLTFIMKKAFLVEFLFFPTFDNGRIIFLRICANWKIGLGQVKRVFKAYFFILILLLCHDNPWVGR